MLSIVLLFFFLLQALWSIIASIILLGNVRFDANPEGLAKFSESGESAATIAKVKL